LIVIDGRPPFVSIIMVAHNDAAALVDSLNSLSRLDYPSDRHEILLIDNGSSDGSAAIIQRFPVRYHHEHRRGVGYGRNLGIEHSRGEILAFTDPDCVVSTGWLKEVVSAFADPEVGIVAGGIVPYPPRTLPELHAARRRSHSQERPLSHPDRPFGMNPNLAFRRAVFSEVGLYDTAFPGGGWEDADLCWRVSRQTQWILRSAPRAVVFHRYRDRWSDFFAQQYRYGLGLGVLHRKYENELHWGWEGRIRSVDRLARSLGELSKSAVLLSARRQDRTYVGLRALDCVREAAQQLGFSIGRLTPRTKYSEESGGSHP
jgi:GT2 family glycosyltransferase